jgi:hypothetical protein
LQQSWLKLPLSQDHKGYKSGEPAERDKAKKKKVCICLYNPKRMCFFALENTYFP